MPSKTTPPLPKTTVEIPEHYENFVDNLIILIKIFILKQKLLKQDLPKKAKLQQLQSHMFCMCQKLAGESDFDKCIEYNVRAKPESDAKESIN